MPAKDFTIVSKTSRLKTTIQQAFIEQEDVVFFDASTYRDTIDAAFIGAGRTLQLTGAESLYNIIPNGSLAEITGAGPVTASAELAADGHDPHIEQSDEFTHTEPRHWEKTRTRYAFYSQAGGLGDFLGAVWVDDLLTITTGQGTITRL